ncbi:MAG: hypothetical protein AAFY76_18470 [Cyanobacteria bacterium J06649_11]
MTNIAQQDQSNEPLFLHISSTRLICLSIVSFGLYEAYWMYKNWQYIKKRDDLNIKPFWRGIFGIFFCNSLLRRIYGDQEARAIQQPTFSASNLATGWIVLAVAANLISRAPGIWAALVAGIVPSYLCLVPVQNYVNAVTQKTNANHTFHQWSGGHIFCIVFGAILWVLLLLGLATGA